MDFVIPQTVSRMFTDGTLAVCVTGIVFYIVFVAFLDIQAARAEAQDSLHLDKNGHLRRASSVVGIVFASIGFLVAGVMVMQQVWGRFSLTTETSTALFKLTIFVILLLHIGSELDRRWRDADDEPSDTQYNLSLLACMLTVAMCGVYAFKRYRSKFL